MEKLGYYRSGIIYRLIHKPDNPLPILEKKLVYPLQNPNVAPTDYEGFIHYETIRVPSDEIIFNEDGAWQILSYPIFPLLKIK